MYDRLYWMFSSLVPRCDINSTGRGRLLFSVLNLKVAGKYSVTPIA